MAERSHWQTAQLKLKRVRALASPSPLYARTKRGKNEGDEPDMGALRFPGSRRPPALWARVPLSQWTSDQPTADEEQEQELMIRVCTEQMRIKSPNALISVLARPVPLPPSSSSSSSSATAADADPEPSDVIPALDDLRKAAERMSAWVITRGLVGPAVVAVGRVMQGSSAPCIGVCPWVAVIDHEALGTKAGKVHHYPVGANYTFATASGRDALARGGSSFRAAGQRQGEAQQISDGAEASAAEEALDSSHTHFLMLDLDGAAKRRADGERGVELRGAPFTHPFNPYCIRVPMTRTSLMAPPFRALS